MAGRSLEGLKGGGGGASRSAHGSATSIVLDRFAASGIAVGVAQKEKQRR